MKSGAEHLNSLKDGRAVYHDGQLVADVTTSTAFRNMAQTAAQYYDAIADPQRDQLLGFVPLSDGPRVSRAWQLPGSYEQLRQRRQALEAMAELTCGWVGRSPDHVASTLAGMVMGASALAKYDQRGAAALTDYFDYARRRDLYLTYCIINPQADKSRPASGQPGADLVAQIVDEDASGIYVSGAKMLATSAVVAQEILVGNIQPLSAGDEACAFTAAIPVNTPGLQFLSRRSYEQAASSQFDYPLSSRYDENDSVVLFDSVRIPWERVFMSRDIKAATAQWHETRAHVMQNHQCLVRLYVKLRFLAGIGRKIAETNGIIGFAPVREALGALAAKATLIEAMVAGMEAESEVFNGYHVPNRSMLCAAQAIAQQTYPQVIEALRQLAGGGLIMLPSSIEDFQSTETRKMIHRSQRSATADSIERVKFFKLAWDAIGSEFASRHLQYEMFYSGSQMILNGHNFRNFDWDRSVAMVERHMASYASPT